VWLFWLFAGAVKIIDIHQAGFSIPLPSRPRADDVLLHKKTRALSSNQSSQSPQCNPSIVTP
jgi:hypothetical protein